MPVYDKVQGAWRELNKSYDKVQGVWRETDKIYDKVQGVWRECYSSGIPINSLPVGAILNIQERDYGLQRYILLQHNYANSGRTLILRERALIPTYWRGPVIDYEYGQSDLAPRLNRNGDLYSSMYQGMPVDTLIQNVTIPCLRSYSDTITHTTFSAAAFLLSAQELFPEKWGDGTFIPYFDSDNKRACFNSAGSAARYWTRTLMSNNRYTVVVRDWGSRDYLYGNDESTYVRPATTLSVSALFTQQSDGTYTLNT